MKLTFAIFNVAFMLTVFGLWLMHSGAFAWADYKKGLGIGILVGAVAAGIGYATVGKNAE